MDFKKIFNKDACPTKIGGQAVLDGIMMKGEDRTAVVVRTPNNRLYIKTERLPGRSKWAEIPIIRGVYVFVNSLMTGMKTLIYSAEVLEQFYEEEESEKDSSQAESTDSESVDETKPAKEKEKEESEGGLPFGVMIALAVALAIVFVVGIFIIVPTVVVNFLGAFTDNAIALNLAEGALRIILFVVYVALISKMKDIQTTFEYHGAEHKTIHCYESGLPLTPDNAAKFETLHPRCGTSFLMFVMIIALLLFSLLGWPNLAIRILSRIVLIPVIAGLSYELLRYAGKSDNLLVKILSIPGLLLQKITTRNPDKSEIQVAIAALKAVLVPKSTPTFEGFCDEDGNPLPDEDSLEFQSALEGM